MEFEFSEEKNALLKKSRDITFEEVIEILYSENYKLIPNPNQKKYDNENAFLIEINGYPHVVPFVIIEGKFILKTIIPMRKYKKD